MGTYVCQSLPDCTLTCVQVIVYQLHLPTAIKIQPARMSGGWTGGVREKDAKSDLQGFDLSIWKIRIKVSLLRYRR